MSAMPRSRLSACVVIAAAAFLTGGTAAGASAQQAAAPLVTVTITSVSPQYARAGQTITVKGVIQNASASPVSGLTVRLRSSAQAFTSRDSLQTYADGLEVADYQIPGAATKLVSPVRPHASVAWTVRLNVSDVGMSAFGVYPLAAEADDSAGTELAVDRTFLPFWPARHSGYLRPAPITISWVWPLIDTPQQGACPGLLSNDLAASLRPGGRLDTLLGAGQAYSAADHLTWAIDPALLGDVQTMTRRYVVGSGATCVGGRRLPADAEAAAWLSRLRRATAGQAMFLTPYADVDVAALVRQNMSRDLARALQLGRSVAAGALGHSLAVGTGISGAGRLATMAWPAGGVASYPVLEALAANKISTVILDSTTMPPRVTFPPTPSAITSTPNGVGGIMRVLLSDDTITRLLGSAGSPSAPAATQFAVEQRFLAETAMIAAEDPMVSRAVVVAPPRYWNPPAALADNVLAETATAPWLRTANLGRLASARHPAGQVPRSSPDAVSRSELSGSQLRRLSQLEYSIQVIEGIRLSPDPQLDYAVAGAESSSWRGAGSAAQGRLISRLATYVESQQHDLRVISQPHVTLGGLNGTIPVSIDNQLSYPVRLRLQVLLPPGSGITLKSHPGVVVAGGRRDDSRPLTVAANTVTTVRLGFRASSVGPTTVGLRLLTPGYTALPGSEVRMTIQVTHYGTIALIIIAAALGIFMLTSASRAMRRGRPYDSPGHAGHSDRGDATGHGPSDRHHGPGYPDRPANRASPGSVVPGHAPRTGGRGATAHGDRQPEEADEYASAPGRTDGR
jgi:hypothetical protein